MLQRLFKVSDSMKPLRTALPTNSIEYCSVIHRNTMCSNVHSSCRQTLWTDIVTSFITK